MQQLQDLQLSTDAYKYLTSLPFVGRTPLKKIYKNANPNGRSYFEFNLPL
jgi:hypothetical protein